MGCAASSDAAAASVITPPHRCSTLQQWDPAVNTNDTTNPLVAFAAPNEKHDDAPTTAGVLHALDATLEHTATPDALARSADIERRAVSRTERHRSASVVARDRSGYEAPQPSAEEHVAHIGRLGAIAGIHGLTPDPHQFPAPEVPAAVMERGGSSCRSWMSGVVPPAKADSPSSHK